MHGTPYIQEVKQVNATRSETPWDALYRSVIFRSLAVYFSIAKFSKFPSGCVCTVMSHNLIIIYPRMLNTMWMLIQICTLIPTPFTRTCASRMAGTPLTPDKISCFSAQKSHLAQKQQHKQQQQQQQTKQQTMTKPFQNLSGLGFVWLQF